MNNVLKHVSLKKYNTFGIEALADNFMEVSENQDVISIMSWARAHKVEPFIVGGGSNILLTQSSYPLIVVNRFAGINKVAENDDHVWIESGAGEVWHDLVVFCIKNNWGGIENLSLIPGTVGAAPMQNIGAYGVEIKEVFESLDAIDMETGELRTFNNEECRFGYRESIFKKELKGKYFITSVRLKLNKNHKINTTYGAIEEVLNQKNIDAPTIKDVSDAVMEIRQSKLPDPAVIGNAGSFFKNPVISKDQFDQMRMEYTQIPGYVQPDGSVKVPAGWLIEQCGWKGKRLDDIGVHSKQALVLVNHGGGTGAAIRDLAYDIKRSVMDKFKVEINPEVNII